MQDRRTFIRNTSAIATAATFARPALAAGEFPKGKAEHCIMIWLGGGACQIDTFDPKKPGDPKTRKPGSHYAAIETAIPGTKVCEHLPNCAKVLDRFNIVRTCNHKGFPDHAAATNFVHTGRATSGTIVYPSIGSLVTHSCGPINDKVPPYILIGYPNVSRGPGYLGPTAGYCLLYTSPSPRDATLSRMPSSA